MEVKGIIRKPAMLPALLWMLLAAALPACAPARAQPPQETIRAFVEKVRACAGKPQVTLGVLGASSDETRLSGAERQLLRRKVEALLQEAGARLMASADLGRILQRLRARGGFTKDKVRKSFARARDVDALVYFNIQSTTPLPRRSARRIVFTLTGITKGECLAASREIGITAETAAAHDFDTLMKEELSRTLRENPDITQVILTPFRAPGGGGAPSGCAGAITARLGHILNVLKSSPDIVMHGRRLSIMLPAGHVKSKGKSKRKSVMIVRGEIRRAGRDMRLRAYFQRGGRGGALLGSLDERITGLGCNPAPVDFITRIITGARHDVKRLRVTAASNSAVAHVDEVDFTIWSRDAARLYCLIVDGRDETGYILFPRASLMAANDIRGGQSKHYPRGFGFQTQIYENVSDNLFGCFALTAPLPEEARATWMAMSGRKQALKKRDIEVLLDQMRATEGIVEGWARVTVSQK